MTASLELVGVGKTFGGVRALDAVSFTVAPGTVTGLMGPNGAGKTVLMDMLTGLIVPDSGTIRLLTSHEDGSEAHALGGQSANVVNSFGVARCWSDARLLGARSVLDEVIIGAYSTRQASLLSAVLGLGTANREARELNDRARRLLAFVGLDGRAHSRAENLSRGERARLGIARALACDPELLLLDGPANGLPAAELVAITEVVLALRDAGLTVLLAERNIKLIADCCDMVVAMNAGRVIAQGNPAACLADPDVQRAYFGAVSGGGGC